MACQANRKANACLAHPAAAVAPEIEDERFGPLLTDGVKRFLIKVRHCFLAFGVDEFVKSANRHDRRRSVVEQLEFCCVFRALILRKFGIGKLLEPWQFSARQLYLELTLFLGVPKGNLVWTDQSNQGCELR